MTGEPPSVSKPDLVLGVIQNYDFAQLESFLSSLRQTGFRGAIVLFHHRVAPADLKAIQRYDVTLIPFRNVRGAFPAGLRRRFFDWLSKHYHCAKWPLYAHGWRLLLSAPRLRYILFHHYLTAHGAQYRRVLLTDTRDVLFQANPFAPTPTADLVFFEESHRLDHGEINGNWIRQQLGEAALDRLGPRMTLCSGTTMGTPEALCCYLERVIALMQQAVRQDLRAGDQAIHNAVAYDGLADVPYSIRYSANGSDEVYTLTQYLETSEIRRGPGGEVVDRGGRPVPIVHQYDRHPEIQAALFERLQGQGAASPAGFQVPGVEHSQ